MSLEKILIVSGGIGSVNGRVDGPRIRAFNLAKALARHPHPKQSYEFSSTQPVPGFFGGSLLEHEVYVKQFNDEVLHNIMNGEYALTHVLNNAHLALNVHNLGVKPVIGPTVVFTVPSPDRLPPQELNKYEDLIAAETEVTNRDWSGHLIQNNDLREIHHRRFGAPHGVFDLMPAGIDTELFKPGDYEGDSILWIGSATSPYKGYDITSKLKERFPNENWILLGAEERFSYEDTPEIFKRAKIIISSSMFETQGIATMEAMASGAAVIQGNQYFTGLDDTEAREHPPAFGVEGEGYQIVERNVEAFSNALQYWLDHPTTLNEQRMRARKYVEGNFSLGQSARLYHSATFRNSTRAKDMNPYGVLIFADESNKRYARSCADKIASVDAHFATIIVPNEDGYDVQDVTPNGNFRTTYSHKETMMDYVMNRDIVKAVIMADELVPQVASLKKRGIQIERV